ncbi:MAG: hypothetical protein ACXVIJ_07995 [Thermoanaerobaculia bacterium]
MRTLAMVVAVLMTTTALRAGSAESLDAFNRAAETYVRLALALGEHDPDWVDAYYGPPAWRDQAKQEKKSVDAIESESRALLGQVEKLKTGTDRVDRLRKRYLVAQLGAVITRAEMLHGLKLKFDDEARRLYGLTPPRHGDAFFASAIASLDKELPGKGDVAQRLKSYQDQFNIPADKLDTVIRAAMAECRARTLAHTELPPGESFTMEYVKNKPWSGYNWYQGNYRSLIQINTDLPVAIHRALDLACHEGYPGHHVYKTLLEKNLVHDRGWVEYSVYPLFSPQSLVAEGTGNYGLEIAFPGREREYFDRDKLFPLAGFDPAEAARYHRVFRLTSKLAYASNEAARRYLDGKITRAQTEAWLHKNALQSPERAKQQVDFIEKYRSYVINYNAGRDAVRAYVEKNPPKKRWPVFIDLISTPRLIP